MRVFFQSIGVLIEYNLGLTSALSAYDDVSVVVEGSLLSYLFGQALLRNSKLRFLPLRTQCGNFVHISKSISRLTRPIYVREASMSDVLHLNQFDGPNTDLLLNLSRPKIFTCHQAPAIKGFEEIADKVDRVVAPSNYTALGVKKTLGYSVDVIHHGVDMERFNSRIDKVEAKERLGLPSEAKIVLWNSRISPEKDLKTLVDAIPSICRNEPNAFFLVKGRAVDPNYRWILRYLEDNLKVRGLHRRVRLWLGWTQHHVLPLLYRAADCFAHTSLWENFGLVFIESMACGTPVVAANTTAAPEVLGEAGVLFTPRDPSDLAEKVLMLLADDGLRERLSQAGIERVKQHFTWKVAARKYLSIYESLA